MPYRVFHMSKDPERWILPGIQANSGSSIRSSEILKTDRTIMNYHFNSYTREAFVVEEDRILYYKDVSS